MNRTIESSFNVLQPMRRLHRGSEPCALDAVRWSTSPSRGAARRPRAGTLRFAGLLGLIVVASGCAGPDSATPAPESPRDSVNGEREVPNSTGTAAVGATETAAVEAPPERRAGELGSEKDSGAAATPARSPESKEPVSKAPVSKEPVSPASQSTAPSATGEPEVSPSSSSGVIALAPGIRVNRATATIELDAVVCIDAGWLEQIACSPGTRDHESLVTVAARPRDVHAALLLLGLEPGAPGSWTFENDVLALVPPRGPKLSVEVRWTSADGVARREPIGRWAREARSGAELEATWRFAGSVTEPARNGRGDHYVADQSGSIIGLVTFGDEVIAFPEVLPDQEGVAPLEYEAWSERLPPIGTPVTLVVKVLDPVR